MVLDSLTLIGNLSFIIEILYRLLAFHQCVHGLLWAEWQSCLTIHCCCFCYILNARSSMHCRFIKPNSLLHCLNYSIQYARFNTQKSRYFFPSTALTREILKSHPSFSQKVNRYTRSLVFPSLGHIQKRSIWKERKITKYKIPLVFATPAYISFKSDTRRTRRWRLFLSWQIYSSWRV